MAITLNSGSTLVTFFPADANDNAAVIGSGPDGAFEKTMTYDEANNFFKALKTIGFERLN